MGQRAIVFFYTEAKFTLPGAIGPLPWGLAHT